jgi:hypothetical protein
VCALSLVRGDDANLLRVDSTLEEARDDLLHVGCLRASKQSLSSSSPQTREYQHYRLR